MSSRALRIRFRVLWSLLLPGLLFGPDVAAGQEDSHAFGLGAHFQSYVFDEALGAEVANLTLIPAAYTLPLGDRFSFDLYGAYAYGQVEQEGVTHTLQGPVDTRVRANYRVTPWAVFTASVNLPTGTTSHDSEEAIVASVLSTDILGFREATWGTGAAVTGGLATAYQIGDWGLGLGASYRLSDGFEPRADTSLTYVPGNEIRMRAALDRNVGEGGTFTAGLTFQNYTEDEFGGKNLFQAGNRLRGDVSYAFRTGRSTWALYAMNVWREEGDRFLYYEGNQGSTPDSTLVVGSQNLLVVGLDGSAPLGSTLRIRPRLDFRYQSREEGGGGGWLLGAGADLPLDLPGTSDLFPRGRFSWGRLEGPDGETKSLWGVELGLTLRWQMG
jgi:hypothetical protein